MEGRIAHLGHQFGTSCLIPGNQKGHERWDCASGLPIWHFMPQPGNQKVSEWIATHLQQIDGLQIQHFACASSGNQEMAKQLCEGVPAPEQYHVTGAVRRSIDSLNFAQHYNPYFLHKFQDAISRHPGIRFMRSWHHWKALNVLFQTTTKPHETNHRKPRYSALKIGQKLCHSAGQNLIRKLTAPSDDFFTPFQQLKRPANGPHPRPQIWQPKGS